ncbi:MAG TPA: ABC transporter ATP-binding protein [Thermoplasmata archaeon]|nr:ABC transporter ATP-binding protein [Thermoplasmata archaeon]
MQEPAVRTEKLCRDFVTRPSFTRRLKGKKTKTKHALREVDLEVREGELFGLLGPNGAGKTTLIKILCTLLLPTSGTAVVGGHDVVREPMKVKEKINMVTGGEWSGYGILTVIENLWMFSQLYGIDSAEAHARIDELIKLVGLEEEAEKKLHKLSTGQKQKMNFCRGFVTDPEILFLDEPTVGLDVEVSLVLRAFVRKWVKGGRGKSVLLTTHYMAEADELCDRVAIINDGNIVACDTPSSLKRLVRSDAVLELVTTAYVSDPFAGIPGVRSRTSSADAGRGTITSRFVLEDESPVGDLVSALGKNSIKLLELRKEEPTLEDVFLKLCGRGLGGDAKVEGSGGGGAA